LGTKEKRERDMKEKRRKRKNKEKTDRTHGELNSTGGIRAKYCNRHVNMRTVYNY
jgi:hypothetical protein